MSPPNTALPDNRSFNSPLPRPLGTLMFLLAWLVPWRPAFRTRASESKLAFFVHHRDTIGRHIAKYGTHEPLVTRWMAEFLAAGRRGIVVDVGANLGWHALHAAQARKRPQQIGNLDRRFRMQRLTPSPASRMRCAYWHVNAGPYPPVRCDALCS